MSLREVQKLCESALWIKSLWSEREKAAAAVCLRHFFFFCFEQGNQRKTKQNTAGRCVFPLDGVPSRRVRRFIYITAALPTYSMNAWSCSHWKEVTATEVSAQRTVKVTPDSKPASELQLYTVSKVLTTASVQDIKT